MRIKQDNMCKSSWAWPPTKRAERQSEPKPLPHHVSRNDKIATTRLKLFYTFLILSSASLRQLDDTSKIAQISFTLFGSELPARVNARGAHSDEWCVSAELTRPSSLSSSHHCLHKQHNQIRIDRVL